MLQVVLQCKRNHARGTQLGSLVCTLPRQLRDGLSEGSGDNPEMLSIDWGLFGEKIS